MNPQKITVNTLLVTRGSSSWPTSGARHGRRHPPADDGPAQEPPVDPPDPPLVQADADGGADLAVGGADWEPVP